MIRKFDQQRLEFFKETRYLTCSGDNSRSGPASSVCNPAFINNDNRTYGSTIPPYKRVDVGDGKIDERFKICEKFLKEWKGMKDLKHVPDVELPSGSLKLDLPKKLTNRISHGQVTKPAATNSVVQYPAVYYKNSSTEIEKPAGFFSSKNPNQSKKEELYPPKKATSNIEHCGTPVVQIIEEQSTNKKEPPKTAKINFSDGSSGILITDALKVLKQYGPQNSITTISKSSGLSLLVSQYNDEETETKANPENNENLVITSNVDQNLQNLLRIPSLNQSLPESPASPEKLPFDLSKKVAVVNPLSPMSFKLADVPAWTETENFIYSTDSSAMSADFEYLHMLNGDDDTGDNNNNKKKVHVSSHLEIGPGKTNQNSLGKEVKIKVDECIDNKGLLKTVMCAVNSSEIWTSKRIQDEGEPATKKMKSSDNLIVQTSEMKQRQVSQKSGSKYIKNPSPDLITIDDDITEIKPDFTTVDSATNSSTKEKDVINNFSSKEEENEIKDITSIKVDVVGRPVGRPRKFKTQKIMNIKDTLLFKAISSELVKYMNTEVYKERYSRKKRAGPFGAEDRKIFLTFLQDHHFLCEISNPALYEILCYFKFLGRRETTTYKNFVTDLQMNLSSQLEQLFTKPSEQMNMFYIYQNLREKFG